VDGGSVFFSGNVTADPVVTNVNGKVLVKFTVAVRDRVRTGDRWVDGDTRFVDVAAWRHLGENVAASVRKGTRVVVRGVERTRQFQRRDGTPGTAVEVTADEVGTSVLFTKTMPLVAGTGHRSNSGLAQVSDDDVDPWAM